MSFDPHLHGLEADVNAARRRVAQQVAEDPDHEVALAMFRADLRRAKERVEQYVASRTRVGSRTYIDGRLAA